MKRSVILGIPFLLFFSVSPALAVQFNHSEHQELLEMDVTCSNCHKEDAKQIVPAKEVCLECHEEDFYNDITFPGTKTHGPTWALNHRAYAKSVVINCSVCHEQEFCLECHKASELKAGGTMATPREKVMRSTISGSSR